MEYLTIKEHHRSHLRGMEPFTHSSYDRRGVESIPRPMVQTVSEPRRSPTINSRPGEDWGQRRSHNASDLDSPSLPPTGLYRNPRAPYPLNTGPSSAYPASATDPRSPVDRGQPAPADWTRSAPTGASVGSRLTADSVRDAEDQKPFKLPSFNSLVEQLERQPESSSKSSDDGWQGRPKNPTYPPLESRSYRPSSSAGLGMPHSEPNSPLDYTAPPHPLLSPRARARRPHYTTHSRRASESRGRAYSALGGPSPRDFQHIPPPTSHHRTQTFPSIITPGAYPGTSSYQSPPLQPGIAPQPHPAEIHGYQGAPARLAAGTLADHGLGHNRTDSVLTSADDYRFHSSTFYANGTSIGHNQRKRRGNLPKDATKILRQWFDEHLDAPYPGEEVKTMLCHQTGLQMSQVNNWFINARRRLPRNDRPRKERESTEGSDDTPTREQGRKIPAGPNEYWR